MATSRNRKAVPEAMAALEQFKYEVASEIGVPLKKEIGRASCRERV